jgi:hypothetical protein
MATATATRPAAKTKVQTTADTATLAKIAERLTATLGGAIDHAHALREEKRAAEKVVKEIEERIAAHNEILFARMDEAATTKGEGQKASASITTATVANVTDWEALWPWIAKTKNFHVVQKRLSDPAVRELWDLKKTLPGVQPFSKRTLNLRSLSK